MFAKLQRAALFLMLLVSAAVLPAEAFASDLVCGYKYDPVTGWTSAPTNGALFPTGGPNGDDLVSNTGQQGVCSGFDPTDKSAIPHHLFSYIMCRFITTLDDVLDKVYCGMQYNLANIVRYVMSVYGIMFGIQLTMGVVEMTMKEAVIRLLKIATITMFFTPVFMLGGNVTSVGISLVFNFFLSMATEGSLWVLSGIYNASGTGINASDATGVMPIYQWLDDLVYNAVFGPFTTANSKVLTFFAAMAFVYPPIFMMAAYWLWENFLILARGLMTFLLGLSAIAFLLTLFPIFLSFMLFQPTRQFFESWIHHMISFALQIIVVFACIGLWVAATSYLVNFFNQVSETLFVSQVTPMVGQAADPADSWSICPYDIDTSSGAPVPVCRNPSFDPLNNATDRKKQILLSKLPEESDYVYALLYNLITLLLVAYAFSALIKQAPQLARELAGPQHVPQLGHGANPFTRYGQFGGGGRGLGGGFLGSRKSGGGAAPASSITRPSTGNIVQQFVQESQKILGKRK